jgi:hypothetical protein
MGLISNGSRVYWPGLVEGSAHALLPGQWDAYRQFEKQLVMPDGATAANKVTASPTGFYNNRCYQPPIQDGEASWRPAGSGDLIANGYAARLADIDFTGSGDFAATAGLIVSAILALVGSGDITLAAQGRVSASITMTGSGDLDATASGLASALLALTGAGDLDALAMGYANASLEIVVTGTGLTTANVGQAVWAAIAALNNTPGTMGEKLNGAGSAGNPWTDEAAIDLINRVREIFELNGLDPAKPLTVTPTTRAAGDISQAITGDGTTSTTIQRA